MALTLFLHHFCDESWAFWRWGLFILNRHSLGRSMWCFDKCFGHSKCEIYRARFVKYFNFYHFKPSNKLLWAICFCFSPFFILHTFPPLFSFHLLSASFPSSLLLWISYITSPLIFSHFWRWRILVFFTQEKYLVNEYSNVIPNSNASFYRDLCSWQFIHFLLLAEDPTQILLYWKTI